MLKTLDEKINPANAGLLVVDMQNDFCSPGGAFDKFGYDITMVREMIPRLVNLIREARAVRLPVIYVKGTYSSDENWFLSEVWLEQKLRRQQGIFVNATACKQGTWGWEIIKELEVKPTDLIVHKHRYDAFLHTDLELILRARGIKSLLITGATTNVCVETTTREAFLRDFYVVLVKDCTGTYERDLFTSTLQNIDKYFGVVASSEGIIACWKKAVLTGPVTTLATT